MLRTFGSRKRSNDGGRYERVNADEEEIVSNEAAHESVTDRSEVELTTGVHNDDAKYDTVENDYFDDEIDDDDDEKELEEEQHEQQRTKNELIQLFTNRVILMMVTLSVGIHFYVILIFGENVILVFAAIFTVFIAMSIITNMATMDNIQDLQEYNAKLREEVYQLASIYMKLNIQVEEDTARVFCLREAESRLWNVTKILQNDAKKSTVLVDENSNIQLEKRTRIRERIIEELATIILNSSSGGRSSTTTSAGSNPPFGVAEVTTLLNYTDTLPSFRVNDDQFLSAIAARGKSTVFSAIQAMTLDVGSLDKPEKDRIFLFDDKDVNLRRAVAERRAERLQLQVYQREREIERTTEQSSL